MCYPIEPWWPDTAHTFNGMTTHKGHGYQTLRSSRRILVRGDVGRITMVNATHPQVGRDRHVYTMTSATIHRFKMLAGEIQNRCLKRTGNAKRTLEWTARERVCICGADRWVWLRMLHTWRCTNCLAHRPD